MTSILLISHGSRDLTQRRQMDAVTKGMKQRFPNSVLETCTLQFGEESLSACLERLAKSGADEIVVVPCFLFDGIHTKKNIPEIVECFQQVYPFVSVLVTDVLGTDERILDIILEKITKLIP